MNHDEVTHQSPREAPDVQKLFAQMESQISHFTGAGSIVQRMEDAHRILHCLWDDQHPDGCKHGDDANPYDGASDVRVRVAEEVVQECALVQYSAFVAGKTAVTPGPSVANNAPEQSQLVLAVLNHTWGQMKQNLRTALRHFIAWKETYGHAVMHVCWHEERDVEARTVTFQEIAQLAIDGELVSLQLPTTAEVKSAVESGQEPPQELMQQMSQVAEMAMDALQAMIADPEREETVVAILAEHDGDITRDEARRVARALRRGDQSVEYFAPYVKSAKPRWEPLLPFVDVFYPLDTTDIQQARWVARVHWLSRVQLEERALIEGWDEQWLEKVRAHPGRAFSGSLLADSWALSGVGVLHRLASDVLEREDCYQIIELHYRAISIAGTPCLYRTILHDAVRDSAAIHEPNPYEHGEFPYIASRRDFNDTALVASRGIPEIIGTQQWAIKGQHDARRDRVALATNPPAVVPQFRAGARYRIAPGEQIPERRTGGIRYLETPRMDVDSIKISEAEWAMIDRYFGRFSNTVPQPVTQLHQRAMVSDFLTDITAAVEQTFKLIRQYRTDEWAFRITGMDTLFHASRDLLQGDYDFTISFDPMDMDLEWLKAKLGIIGEVVLPLDSDGATDRTKLLQFAFTAIDPGLAAQVLRQSNTLQQDETEDEQNQLNKILNGLEPAFKIGQNHAGRSQFLRKMATVSPPVAKRLQEDETVRALFEARLQMHEQQVAQEQNRIIGRMGAAPVLGQ